MSIDLKALAAMTERMLLRPDATKAHFERLCEQARGGNLRAIVVPTSRVALCGALLEESDVKVVAAVGFPFGTAEIDAKRYEVELAVDLGAQEIDVVLHHGFLKERGEEQLYREIRDLVEAADERPVRVAVDPKLLNAEDLLWLGPLVSDSEASGVCLGTGLGGGTATAEVVKAIRSAMGPKFWIKASGVSAALDAFKLVEAGADAIGQLEKPE